MRRRAHSVLVFITLCVGASCSLDNPGDPPPEGTIYLPGGLHISEQSEGSAPRLLYVVNSNFDLRYNAGSLQAYDLDELDARIAECDELGPTSCEIEPKDVLVDEVLVPSLVTGLTASSDFSRLYVSARTEARLTVVDVDESSDRPLSCGDTDRRCDDAHTNYTDPLESQRRLELPREAVSIVSGPASEFTDAGSGLEGELLMVAHRGGEISLFRDTGSRLELHDVLRLGSSARPLREPTGIAFDPVTRLAYVSLYARDSIEIGDKKVLARVGIAANDDPEAPATLFDTGALSIEGVSLGRDTRGLAMNPLVSGQSLVVSRVPNSLLWVDVAPALEGRAEAGPTQAIVWRTVSIGRGPSRVITGQLGDRTVAIVSCLDGREVYILDVATAQPISIIHNFSGPFELALDSARQRLYVADFRSSVVRVVDLSPLVEGASENVATARIIATLGHPELVQELQ